MRAAWRAATPAWRARRFNDPTALDRSRQRRVWRRWHRCPGTAADCGGDRGIAETDHAPHRPSPGATRAADAPPHLFPGCPPVRPGNVQQRTDHNASDPHRRPACRIRRRPSSNLMWSLHVNSEGVQFERLPELLAADSLSGRALESGQISTHVHTERVAELS